MKKIINGKRYDTDTAKPVAYYQNGYGDADDLRYVSEELYIKKTGEWFIWGSGGADTKYGIQCGPNTYCGGLKIIPITEEEAKKWLEKHNFVEEYIKYFGEPEE